MIKKIISGGQTGADRAALDVAIKLNIEHGGWIPKGRKTEEGPLSENYKLTEMESTDYRERTRQNIIDSQGTVIISRAEPTGGSKLTRSYAKVLGRPNCFLNLSLTPEFEAADILKMFVLENRISVLNVAGPRLSSQPWIYQDVKTILEVMLYLLFSESDQAGKIASYIPVPPHGENFPKTIEDAIQLLCGELPLKTRTFIASFDVKQIYMLYFSFQDYIKQRLGFNTGNDKLLKACSQKAFTQYQFCVEDAVMVILKTVKKRLEPDHILRAIK